MSPELIARAQTRSLEMLDQAHIPLTLPERAQIEVCDFRLGDLETFGVQIVVYVNTPRCCAKELIMFPGQICPEHLHPPIDDYPGKEETFRCRWGEVYLYVPGEPTPRPKGRVPAERREYFKVWHEVVLHPGDQYTIKEGTPHWFQGGPQGAIVSEFSTTSYDEHDVFTDPDVLRMADAAG